MLDSTVVSPLIDYLVKRGYDSDDLVKMNPFNKDKTRNYRRSVHLIQLVAEGCPKLKNKHFLSHITVFLQQNFMELTSIQQIRTYLSVKKLVNLKNNEKLMAMMKKATMSRVLSETKVNADIDNDEELFNQHYKPDDDEFYTDVEEMMDETGRQDDNDFDITSDSDFGEEEEDNKRKHRK